MNHTEKLGMFHCTVHQQKALPRITKMWSDNCNNEEIFKNHKKGILELLEKNGNDGNVQNVPQDGVKKKPVREIS